MYLTIIEVGRYILFVLHVFIQKRPLGNKNKYTKFTYPHYIIKLWIRILYVQARLGNFVNYFLPINVTYFILQKHAYYTYYLSYNILKIYLWFS